MWEAFNFVLIGSYQIYIASSNSTARFYYKLLEVIYLILYIFIAWDETLYLESVSIFREGLWWCSLVSLDIRQKQRPEVFCTKRCYQKFRKIHRKIPVPESQACNFIKKETLTRVFSSEFCEISKNTFFTEHLWATASA